MCYKNEVVNSKNYFKIIKYGQNVYKIHTQYHYISYDILNDLIKQELY